MMRTLNATLLTIITTTFVCSALLLALPFEFSEKALWLTLFVPLIWAALMFWSSWEKSNLKVFLGLLVLTLVSIAIVILNPPVG